MVVDAVVLIVPYNEGAQHFAINVDNVRAKETLGDSSDVPEAFWRTLIANQTGGHIDGSLIIWDQFEKVNMLGSYHRWKRYMEDSVKQGQPLPFVSCLEERFRWFCMQILHIFKERRFFATRRGRIGIGPSAMRIEDEVCVFFYCPTPYTLRRGCSINEFIGEAYVHGLMYGQALDMLDRGKLEETQFVLG